MVKVQCGAGLVAVPADHWLADTIRNRFSLDFIQVLNCTLQIIDRIKDDELDTESQKRKNWIFFIDN